MIKDLLSDKQWTKGEKVILFTVFGLLAGLLLFSFFAWLKGVENIIGWDTVTQLQEKTFQQPPLFLDDFSFSATAPLWYVTESYQPSPLTINAYAYWTLLVSVLVGLSLILSALSRLRGFWFLAGALMLGLVVSTFRLESNFLVSSKWPFLVVFAVTGLTYYFTNYFAEKLSIVKNVLVWSVVWGLIIWGISKYSIINEPLLSMAAFGLVAAIFITALFVFLTSHEIISALYKIVSDSAEKKRSLFTPYLVVTVVVLFNAVLIYLENAKTIDRSKYIFAPIAIFLLSLALGFKGFKDISGQKKWFSWEGVGLLLYLGWSIVSAGTVALAYATHNDPLMEFLEDFISISFLAMSLGFAIYVLANFLPLINQGMAFHKVIYKGPFTRLLLIRIGAAFLVLLIFSFKKKFSFYQLQSGLNNAVADFYLKEGDLKSAETYYKYGANFDLYNQRSNLALASIASAAGDQINTVYFYHQAGERTPSVQSFIGESRALEEQDMYFEAVFNLNKGLEVFPDSPHLYTNLARLQAKAGLTDSTLYNINKAKQLCQDCETENVNFLGFWVENGKPEKLDEMRKLTGKASGYSFKANQSAIRLILGEEITLDRFEVSKDSALDMGRSALLLNGMTSSKTVNETAIQAKTLLSFQENRLNDAIYEPLSWAYASQNYYRENKPEGFKQLAVLAGSNSPLAQLYSQNLGLWYIREGALSSALPWFEKAGDTTSVNLLVKSDIQEKLNTQQKAQADALTKNLKLESYKEIVNKAPLNPWLLIKVSDFLSKNNQNLEAYNVVFYGMDFIKDSPELLKTYIDRALKLSMFDYAEDGLAQLSRLGLSSSEMEKYKSMIQKARAESQQAF